MTKSRGKYSLLFYALMLISVIGIGYNTSIIVNEYISAERDMIKKMQLDTQKAAKELDKNLKNLVDVTTELEEIAYKKLSQAELEKTHTTLFKEHPELFGIGVCYEPNALFDSTRLYTPFYFRPGEKDTVMNLDEGENGYDYTTNASGGWYRSIRDGKNWQEPYFGRVAQAIIAEFGIPIYQDKSKKGDPIGIVYSDYSLNEIKGMMKALQFGKTGYAYILSEQGVVLSHPIEEYVKNSRNIREIADNQDDGGELHLFLDKAAAGEAKESDVYINVDAKSGQTAWRVFSKIPTTNWTLVTIFPEDELDIDVNSIRHSYIVISIFVILGLLAFFISRSLSDVDNVKNHWSNSNIITVIFVMNIVFLYYVSLKHSVHQVEGSAKILNNSTKDKFLDVHAPPEKNKYKLPLMRIPSGINVKSYELIDANNVFITGYLWQKYDTELGLDTIIKDKGFVFPQATSTHFSKAYERTDSKYSVHGWKFESQIRLPLNYKKFPFDNKVLNLGLWHSQFDRNIILVPDLDSYAYTNPTARPGLEKSIVFGNWNVISSFYSYVKKSFDTKYGLNNSSLSNNDDVEEMNFSIVLERKFIGPLIANLLPFLCILLIHFASVMNMKNESKTYVLSASSGLIFAVLIAHFSMRGSLNYAGVVYLESLYFVAYLVITLSIINNFLFYSGRKVGFLTYNKGIAFRVMYWPIVCVLLYVVTVFTYY